MELLSFCVQRHGYHIRHYIINKNLLGRVLVLMTSTHPHLALGESPYLPPPLSASLLHSVPHSSQCIPPPLSASLLSVHPSSSQCLTPLSASLLLSVPLSSQCLSPLSASLLSVPHSSLCLTPLCNLPCSLCLLLYSSLSAALRFCRKIVGLKDDFYDKYIVRQDLFKPIVTAFLENGQRYNLLNSAAIELFTYINSVS